MRHFVLSLVVMMLGAMVFTTGCPKKTAQAPSRRVAGTQQQYGTKTPTTTTTMPTKVMVDITGTGITVTPSKIPAGTFDVVVMNKTTMPETFTWKGGGKTQKVTLAPGKSTTVTMTNPKPGT